MSMQTGHVVDAANLTWRVIDSAYLVRWKIPIGSISLHHLKVGLDGLAVILTGLILMNLKKHGILMMKTWMNLVAKKSEER
mgnify:CR=1 FL=1